MNWENSNKIGFWIHIRDKLINNEDLKLKFALVNNGIVSEKINVENLFTQIHGWKEVDISNLKRDKVRAIRFHMNVSAEYEIINQTIQITIKETGQIICIDELFCFGELKEN